jgi:hypothetical protein
VLVCFSACSQSGTNTETWPTNTNTQNNTNEETESGGEDEGGESEPVLSPNEITSAEWTAILAITNYEASSTTNKKTTTYKASQDALMVETPSNGTTYYAIRDGKTYRISNGMGIKVNQGFSIGDMVLKGIKNKFSDMVYDKESATYTLTVSDGNITTNGEYTFKFENGTLVTATFKQGVTKTTIEFSNYGTTEVDLPDFEVPAW